MIVGRFAFSGMYAIPAVALGALPLLSEVIASPDRVEREGLVIEQHLRVRLGPWFRLDAPLASIEEVSIDDPGWQGPPCGITHSDRAERLLPIRTVIAS